MRKILLRPESDTAQYTTYSLGHPGRRGFSDGSDTSNPRCSFSDPTGLRVHRDGSVFVLDSYNSRIRIISADFTSVSSLEPVVDLFYARRFIFTSDFRRIIIASATTIFGAAFNVLTEVKISDSRKVKVVGQGSAATADGVGRLAKFNQPGGLAWTSEGALLVAQAGDGAIRVVDWATGSVSTLVTAAEAAQSGITAVRALAYKVGVGQHVNRTNGVFAGGEVSSSESGRHVYLIQWAAGPSRCSACPAGKVRVLSSNQSESETAIVTADGKCGKTSEDCIPAPTTSTTPQPNTTSTPSTSPLAATTTPAPAPIDPVVVTTVQTVIAATVAASVTTAVATSVVAAASGGAQSSGSGTMSAITQTQMLTQAGRIGGRKFNRRGVSSATCGMGWSNYNPRSLGAEGFLGRNAPTYCAKYTRATDSCSMNSAEAGGGQHL